MRLNLSRTWTDAMDMLRGNVEVVSGVAGMFIFLPVVLSSWITPDFEAPAGQASISVLIHAANAYFAANWPPMFLSMLVTTVGTLALLVLLLDRSRPTVAQALRVAVTVLPVYFLANLLQGLAVVFGFFLFLLPGLYIIARLFCLAPVAAVESVRNPLAIITRSWAVTRGNGGRILLMIVVVFTVALVLSSALVSVSGIVTRLILSADLARLVEIIVDSLTSAAMSVVIAAMSASIYRQLS